MTHLRTLSFGSTSTARSDSSHSVLNIWNSACRLYDAKNFLSAYEQFSNCALTAKCLFNQALCLIKVDQPPESPLTLLLDSTTIDSYFVPAWILLAELCMKEQNWAKALEHLHSAQLGMREISELDLAQLGLGLKIKLAQILLLKASCYRELEQSELAIESALSALQADSSFKPMISLWLSGASIDTHFFEWDIFRPTPLKLAALEPNDYLGNAMLVASSRGEVDMPVLIKCHYRGEVCRWIERNSKELVVATLKSQIICKFEIHGNCKIFTKSGQLLIDDYDLRNALHDQSKLRLNIEDY